jgi:hypothetical protein
MLDDIKKNAIGWRVKRINGEVVLHFIRQRSGEAVDLVLARDNCKE